jgi:hypothetical protein
MRHGKAATMMLLQRLLRPHESAVDLQLDAPSPAALLGGQPLLVEVMDDTRYVQNLALLIATTTYVAVLRLTTGCCCCCCCCC